MTGKPAEDFSAGSRYQLELGPVHAKLERKIQAQQGDWAYLGILAWLHELPQEALLSIRSWESVPCTSLELLTRLVQNLRPSSAASSREDLAKRLWLESVALRCWPAFVQRYGATAVLHFVQIGADSTLLDRAETTP